MATCPQCGTVNEGRFCSNCGSPFEKEKSGFRIFRTVLGPLYDYAMHAKDIFRPEHLVAEVRAGKFDAGRLFAFALTSAVISTIIYTVFPSEEPAEGIWNIPIVSDLVNALFMILASILLSLPMHFILNRMGRKATLGQYSGASIALSALIGPWVNLASVLLILAGAPMLGLLMFIVAQYPYILVYSRLYELPQGKVALWFIASFVGFVVFFTAIIYFALLQRPI